MDQSDILSNNGQNYEFPENVNKILCDIDANNIDDCNEALEKINLQSQFLEQILDTIMENSSIRNIMLKSINFEANDRLKLILLFNFICIKHIEYCRKKEYLIEFIFSSYHGTLSLDGLVFLE